MPTAGAVGTETVDVRVAIDLPASSPAPDWSSITETIRCPLCRYDLRGLIEPRCPECGYRFNWPDLLDRTRREHPFLFEQHPERSIRSFVRTTLEQWRPRRFWSSLRPSHLICRRRIVMYWLVVTGLVVAAFAAYAGRVHLQTAAASRASYRAMLVKGRMRLPAEVIRRYGSIDGYLDATYPGPFSSVILRTTYDRLRQDVQQDTTGLFVLGAMAYFVWPWLTILCVMGVFRWSARRARIGTGHVMRAIIYSQDIGAWIAVIAIVLIVLPRFSPEALVKALFSLIVLAAPIAMLRLMVAFKTYLGLDRPLLTALTVQCLVLFTMAVAVVVSPLMGWIAGCVH